MQPCNYCKLIIPPQIVSIGFSTGNQNWSPSQNLRHRDETLLTLRDRNFEQKVETRSRLERIETETRPRLERIETETRPRLERIEIETRLERIETETRHETFETKSLQNVMNFLH